MLLKPDEKFVLPEDIPLAVYVLSHNPDLNVVSMNNQFFNLIGINKEGFRVNYGNKLAAILDKNSLEDFNQRLGHGKKQAPITVEQHIVYPDNKNLWINTIIYPLEDEKKIYCISYDISRYKHMEQNFAMYKAETVLVGKQVKIEAFSYNIEKQTARIINTNLVPLEVSLTEQQVHQSFQEAVIKKGIIHPDYTRRFRHTFREIKEGADRSASEIKIKTWSGDYIWYRFRLEKLETEGKGKYAIGILENIAKEKEVSLNYLNEKQFFQAILSDKEAYGQVDVTDDIITRVGGIWNIYNEIIGTVSYSRLIEEFINKVVHPDDRRQYLDLMQCDNFIFAYQNGVDRLGCEFRRIVNQNKMMWMELCVRLFREPLTNHIVALIYLENIDSRKKREGQGSKPDEAHSIKAFKNHGALETEDSFEAFVGEQGDMAYLVDPVNFTLLCGNQAFYNRIGMTKERCENFKCYQILHKRESPCPFCSKANWTPDKYYMWRNINNVFEQEFLIKNKLVQWRGKTALLALAVDISNNKSIVDSLENGATESHSVISGIQRMAEAPDLDSAMAGALESIGIFFRADRVQFWEKKDKRNFYTHVCQWRGKMLQNSVVFHADEERKINRWISEQNWLEPIYVENPEAMLCYSYEMYEMMEKWGIRNLRWFPLREGESIAAFISIENMSANFENISFMESFSSFFLSERNKRRMMEEIIYVNEHDALTNLLNRRSYESFCKTFRPDDTEAVGVIMLNINGMRKINTSKGSAAGDSYIKQLARLLKKIFRHDKVFRLNGDEFLIICDNIKIENMEKEIRRLTLQISKIDSFTVAAGYAWDNVEKDLEALCDHATQVMRINKKRFYDTNMVADTVERHKMLQDLIKSLNNNEFEVFLQPKIELSTNRIIGAEALIRYRHEEMGIVPPVKFVGLLERNNLIRYIDLFVLKRVCEFLEQWKDKELKALVISFNFSRLTILEEDIITSMENIVSGYSFSRNQLEIEITESIADTGKSILYQVTKDLNEVGYAIALDDFGTKYTNLSILSEMDLDVLKLDKSLVHELAEEKRSRVIVQNVIRMCNDLDIDVIAEGVETREQEKILKKLGCRWAQGYLYGKPMPAEDFITTCLGRAADK